MKSLNLKLLTAFAVFAVFISKNDVNAQGAAINTSGTNADPSAILDVSSSQKGILIPRLTEQEKNSIALPATGLIIYQTDGTAGLWYYDGASWKTVDAPLTGDNLGNHIADMDLNMSSFGINNVANPGTSLSAVNAAVIQNSSLTYSDATGSNNNYEVTLTPNITSYTKGMSVTFKANFENTASPTVNINNLGAKAIKKNGFIDVAPYDILVGQIINVVYDGTNFQMINEPGIYNPLYAFISSTAYSPATSVSSRDSYCQSEATAAGLPGTYKAWVNNSGSNNVPATQYRSYYRPDNKLVASSWADLTDGNLANPINISANGSTYNETVWTGLNANGTAASNDCSGWSSTSSSVYGQTGTSSSTTSTWTNSNPSYACGNATPGVVGYADYNSGASCPSCYPGSSQGNYVSITGIVKRNMNINGNPVPCSSQSMSNFYCYQCNGTVYTANSYRHYCFQQP